MISGDLCGSLFTANEVLQDEPREERLNDKLVDEERLEDWDRIESWDRLEETLEEGWRTASAVA